MHSSSIFSITSAALGTGFTAFEALGHYPKSPQVFIATTTLGAITSLFINLVTMKGNEISGILSIGVGLVGPLYRTLPKNNSSHDIIRKFSFLLERISQVYRSSLITLDLGSSSVVSSGFSFGFMMGQLASALYYSRPSEKYPQN